MITIDLTKPGYREAFADCEVGETKTVEFTVTEKTDDKIVGEMTDSGYEHEAEPEAENYSSGSGSKMPKGVAIVIGKMK